MNLIFEEALRNPVKANQDQNKWHEFGGFQYVVTVKSTPESVRPVWHLSVFAGNKFLKQWSKSEIEQGLTLIRSLALEIGVSDAAVQGGKMALNFRRELTDAEMAALDPGFIDSHTKYHEWYMKSLDNKRKRQNNPSLN